MKGKVLVIMVCTLLISLAVPTSIVNGESITPSEEDVEINISAGFRGHHDLGADRNLAGGACFVEDWDREPKFFGRSQSSADTIFGIDDTITDKPVLEITEIKGGFGVKAIIKNIGNVTATNVYWSIFLEGGLVILGKKMGFVSSLSPGDSTIIRLLLLFGIGKPTITITAECAEGTSVIRTVSGTLLLFFLLDLK